MDVDGFRTKLRHFSVAVEGERTGLSGGWHSATCHCGFKTEQLPGIDLVIDEMMAHAIDATRQEES